MTRYLLAGGGTAGHVNPLLAVADRIRESEPDATIVVLGTAGGLEARLVPDRGYELLTIDRVTFPRRLGSAAFHFATRFRTAVRETRNHIAVHHCEVVVGFGGFVSGPAYLAAWLEKVPIVVHEANAIPGLANRLGSWLTQFVGVAFRGTRLRHARFVGMPIRRELETLNRAATWREAVEYFRLNESKPVLLVTGGSLGAQNINETVFASAATILGCGWQLLHITGERSPLAASDLVDYHVVPYCDRMDLAFAAAELVIARAGSATVSEVTALGLAAVYVPLAIGNGEQRKNVRDVIESGGALMVEDAKFSRDWIDEQLVPLLQNRGRIATYAARAKAVGVADGTSRTVALIADAVAASKSMTS